MTQTDRNVQTVRDIYSAFSRGEIAAILERLSPEVAWEFGAGGHGVPWLQSGTGREAAGRFFALLGGLELHDFGVLAVMGAGEWVVGLARIEFTVKATGRRFRDGCEPHVWRFDPEGRVIAMRHAADTWEHARAAGLLPA